MSQLRAGGYGQLLKKPRTRPKKTAEQKKIEAKYRVEGKLGKKEYLKISSEFSAMSTSEQDGCLRTLLNQNRLSQVEIRSFLPVGGYRLDRLSRDLGRPVPGPVECPAASGGAQGEALPSSAQKPWHAVTQSDIDAIAAHISTWEIEPGFPCAHRIQLEYLADPTLEWGTLHEQYRAEREMSGERVLSPTRWREYVRHLKPRLRRGRVLSDLCNTCYRLDIELKQPNLSEERRADILLQKQTHLAEAKTQRKAMNCAIKDYKSLWFPGNLGRPTLY